MEIKVKNREWVKNAAIIFLAVLLVLTQVKRLKKIHPAAYIGVGAVIGVILSM